MQADLSLVGNAMHRLMFQTFLLYIHIQMIFRIAGIIFIECMCVQGKEQEIINAWPNTKTVLTYTRMFRFSKISAYFDNKI